MFWRCEKVLEILNIEVTKPRSGNWLPPISPWVPQLEYECRQSGLRACPTRGGADAKNEACSK